MKPSLLALSLLLITSLAQAGTRTAPNWNVTPGTLCSEDDPEFEKLDYPEQIARCKRSVSHDEKERVAHDYGDIAEPDWYHYEFDHLIPLCAGGANDERNLWPQPIAEAHEKDKLEDEICEGMKAGTLTQKEAVQKVHDWFEE